MFLIVDDDQRFRTQMGLSLRRRGLMSVEVGSLSEARDALSSNAQLARVILDLRIGQESGLELLRWVRQLHSKVSIVVLTGYGSIATAQEALLLGAVRYLVKPCSLDAILEAFGESSGPSAIAATDRADSLTIPTLAQVEWDHIQRVLHDEGGNVTHAAKKLGLDRRSLQRKLSKPPRIE